MSDENVGGLVEDALKAQGVFAGAHGLCGLADANAFWERQPYGTRLYYGDGIADYLHRGVLRSAIAALSDHGQPVVDEAIRLLRAYRSAPKFSNDHAAMKRVVSLEDEIDTFLYATPMTGALGATP